MALNFDDIDVSKISITTPQRTKRSGMLMAYLNTAPSGRNLQFQTPRMLAQWGIKEWDRPGQDPDYSLALPFRNIQNDPDIKAFYDKMQELDEHIIQTALAHSPEWFNGKTLSEETIRDKYSPIVKPSPEERWAPKLNLKLFKKDGVWSVQGYDEDGEVARGEAPDGSTETGLDVLKKGDEIICAVEVAYVFINAQSFGPTLRVKQAMIYKSKEQDFETGCQIVPRKGPSQLESYRRTREDEVAGEEETEE